MASVTIPTPTDPISIVHRAIWNALEEFVPWTALIKQMCEIRYDTALPFSPPGGRPDQVADTPKVVLEQSVGNFVMSPNARVVSIEQAYPLIIVAQDQNVINFNAGTFGDALLAAVEKKGKLPLSQMGDDLSVIYRKALEFGSRLFKNVDLRPLTDELDSMYHLLDQTTAAGAKLGDGVAKGTSGIASAFGEAIDKAQVWYLKTATFALKVDTALMPVEKTIRRITSAMDTTVGKLLLATATLGLYDATGHSKPVIKQTSAITNGRKTLFDAAAAVRVARLSGALKGEELQKAGDSLADSLAAGYRQGMIEREDIIRLEGVALGKAAVAGIKEGQKSHSPSRATMQLGGYLGQGLVLGMRGHAGEVGRAGHFLGAHAVASIGGRTGGSGTSRAAAFSFNGARERRGESRGASGGKSIQISRLELNVNAPHGVTDATEVTAAGVAIALEHLQLMSGA